MPSKLYAELHITKPIPKPEETFLSIKRTSGVLSQKLNVLFKQNNITQTQYNILRILRGSQTSGLACMEIANRMITEDSDVTRLLDRLEKAKMIRRTRSSQDGRRIMVFIEQKGLEVLSSLDHQVQNAITQMMKAVDEDEMSTLIRLLEKLRP